MALLGVDAGEEGLDVVVAAVVAAHRNAAAAQLRHLGCRLVDRARQASRLGACRSARDVDGCPRLAEAERDALTQPPARTGDHHHRVAQAAHRGFTLWSLATLCDAGGHYPPTGVLVRTARSCGARVRRPQAHKGRAGETSG